MKNLIYCIDGRDCYTHLIWTHAFTDSTHHTLYLTYHTLHPTPYTLNPKPQPYIMRPKDKTGQDKSKREDN